MPAIASVRAKEILDSQGHPTIEVALTLDNGQTVTTSVPNGIRRYPQEAFVLTDQDPNHMEGRGVGKAVALINQTIGPQLVGQDPTQQATLDQWLLSLDATPQKSQAGANTFAAVSQAILKAGAAATGLPLYQYLISQHQLTDHVEIPTCLYGLVNGGQYGAGNLDIQEFLIMPASHSDYRVSLEIESSLRNELQRLLQKNKANYSTGALGGFTPTFQKNSDVFEYIIEAARNTAYILSRDFFFGIDTGAETLAQAGKYVLKDKGTAYSEKELVEFYADWREKYNLTYFEDPFLAKDTSAWRELTGDIGDTTRIAGDIVMATNPGLVKQAVDGTLCNTLVVKPSQIGTITETLEAIKTARQAGWSIVISQRTGETNDDFLADFAVGVGAELVKFGPTNRGEAVSKYNRLADIYRELEQTSAQGATMTDPTLNQIPVNEPVVEPVVELATEPTLEPAVEPTLETMTEPVVPMPSDTLPQPATPPMGDMSIDQPPMNVPQNLPATPSPALDTPVAANTPVMPAPVATPTPVVAPTTPSPVPAAPSAATTPDAVTSPIQPSSAPLSQLETPVQINAPIELPQPTPADTNPSLPLPTTPPAPAEMPLTPAPAPEDTKALEQDLQQVIDSSVAQIGELPTPAVGTLPAAPVAADTTPAPPLSGPSGQ